MPSLLIISSHFPPRQAAGVYRTLRFARYLPALGWTTHVLTLDPDSFEDGVELNERLLARVPDSVVVHRTRAMHPFRWLLRARSLIRQPRRQTSAHATASAASPREKSIGAHRPSIWQRIKDWATLPLITPDRMIGWIPFAVRKGRDVVQKHSIDVLYSSGPPWTNHLVGLRLKRCSQRPWIADFRDPWVGSNFREQRRGDSWAGRKHRELEKKVVQLADRIILNTKRSYEEMRGRYHDLPAEKFLVITNGFDPADFSSIAPQAAAESGRVMNPPPGKKMTIAHAGSFYGKRNIAGFIQALGNVCRNGQVARDRISVELIGARRPGRVAEVEQVAQADLQDVVHVLPGVPHEQCLQRLLQSDVLLLVQTEAPLCIPGKVFEYIAIGRPVLTLSEPGATTDLVREEGLGLAVDPSDLPGMESAIVDLYQRFQAGKLVENCAAETRNRYDGENLTGELHRVAIELLNGRASDIDQSAVTAAG